MKIFVILFLFIPFFIEALLITEVQIAGEENVNECYIKIYNSQEIDIDISGYNLRKKTSSGNDSSIRVLPKESIIKSKDYFIWASSKIEDFPTTIGANTVSTQYLSSNNSIALLNKEKNIISAVSWGDGEDQYLEGSPLSNPLSGQIITRKKGDNLYSNEKDSSVDFFLYPEIEETEAASFNFNSKEESEEKKINVFLVSFLSSLLLAFIVLFINGRTQSL